MLRRKTEVIEKRKKENLKFYPYSLWTIKRISSISIYNDCAWKWNRKTEWRRKKIFSRWIRISDLNSKSDTDIQFDWYKTNVNHSLRHSIYLFYFTSFFFLFFFIDSKSHIKWEHYCHLIKIYSCHLYLVRNVQICL